MAYPKLIEQMINQFAKLPGVGRRTTGIDAGAGVLRDVGHSVLLR